MSERRLSYAEIFGFRDFKKLEIAMIINNHRICPNCGTIKSIWKEMENNPINTFVNVNDEEKMEILLWLNTGLCNKQCREEYIK